MQCSHCTGVKLHRHGRFWRWVTGKRQRDRIPIYRWICPCCRKTTSVFPDLIRPYAHFLTILREHVVRRRLFQGRPWRRLAREISTTLVSLVSEKTLRRWMAGARGAATAWNQYLAARILRLAPATDLYAIAPRRDGADVALHFLVTVGDWIRSAHWVHARGHPGLFPFLSGLPGVPAFL